MVFSKTFVEVILLNSVNLRSFDFFWKIFIIFVFVVHQLGWLWRWIVFGNMFVIDHMNWVWFWYRNFELFKDLYWKWSFNFDWGFKILTKNVFLSKSIFTRIRFFDHIWNWFFDDFWDDFVNRDFNFMLNVSILWVGLWNWHSYVLRYSDRFGVGDENWISMIKLIQPI